MKIKDFIKREVLIILVVSIISGIAGFFYFVNNEKGYDYFTCFFSVGIMIYGFLTMIRLGAFLWYLVFDFEF